MSFQEKINTFFNKIEIKLTDKPAKRNLHLYADFVEIVSLFSNSNIISSNDILDRFFDEGKEKQVREAEYQADENDKNEVFINTIFDVIKSRADIYKEKYPFNVTPDNKINLIEKVNITEVHKIYLYLLISSNLNYFGAFESEITKEFETLSFNVLKTYLPTNAIIKSFGKNSEYIGTALEKITTLAKDLSIKTDSDYLNETNVAGNQERGLDLIGWLPFNDYVPNFIIFTCQCACGKKWKDKVAETKRFNLYFTFKTTKPIHTLFIPYCLQHPQKSIFFQGDEIAHNLIFERKRLLDFINDNTFFKSFDSYSLVEKCIEYEEDIV